MKHQKRIIIVDDDLAIQDALRIMLESNGYITTLLSSGETLLLNSFELPDLFILDKQLPGVDGLDICRHLKAGKITRHIPVLVLSASLHIAPLAGAAGANDFLEKPFRMKILLETVQRLISRNQ